MVNSTKSTNKNIFTNKMLSFYSNSPFLKILLKVKKLKNIINVNTLPQKYLFTISGDKQRYIVRKLRKYINLVQCHYFSKVKNASDNILNKFFQIFTPAKCLLFMGMNVVFRPLCLWYIDYTYVEKVIFTKCRVTINPCYSVRFNQLLIYQNRMFLHARAQKSNLNEISCRLCHLINIRENEINATSNNRFSLKASLRYYWIIAIIHGIYCHFLDLKIPVRKKHYRELAGLRYVSPYYTSFKQTFNYFRSSNYANIN